MPICVARNILQHKDLRRFFLPKSLVLPAEFRYNAILVGGFPDPPGDGAGFWPHRGDGQPHRGSRTP